MKKYLLLSIGLASGISTAAPVISSSRLNTDDGTIEIQGVGFGSKTQAAPVLWVMGRDVRENGNQNTDYEKGNTITDKGNLVPVGVNQIWSRGIGTVFDDSVRYPGLEVSYLAKNNGWLGWPKAYGADDTPLGYQAFISFRIKPWWNIEFGRTVAYSSISGQFNTGNDAYSPGEDISITAEAGREFSGKIIHIDTNKKIIHFYAAGISNRYLQNAEMQGLDSNTSAILDSDHHSIAGGSSKYFRSYENVWLGGGAKAIRVGDRWIGAINNALGSESSRVFEKPDGSDLGRGVVRVSDKLDWRLMENYIDLRGPTGKGYNDVDNIKKKWFYGLNLLHKAKDGGPTLSNIGFEAAGATIEINSALNYGEVYFDKTPQRVVLSNKSQYSEITADLEYQHPTIWQQGSDGILDTISAELRFGALDQSKPIYIYVFDENNEVNQTGCEIYKTCISPPEKPILKSINQL